MRSGSLLFLAGVLTLVNCAELPPRALLVLLPLCLYLGLRVRPFFWPLCFVCGLLWATLRADLILGHGLDPQLEGQHLVVDGVISSLPEKSPGSSRFMFDVSRLQDARGTEHPYPRRLRLHWYAEGLELVPGDRWRLRVRLKRPHGFMNPGGFDYEAWLFRQGVTATGYVARRKGNTLLQQGPAWQVHRMRYQLREQLALTLGSGKNAALVPALVVGDRSAMDDRQWRILTATGTSHLLAISGLHIGLVASMIYFMARRLWPLGGVTALLIPAPVIAAGSAMLGALVYAALAGFSVPTQRALLMLLVVLAATLASRRLAISAVLALALWLVLILDPFAVLSAGFWLSFGAIAVIVFGMAARAGDTDLWWRWGRVQYLVALGLLPLLASWFQQLPLTSVLANLVVVPWVSFISVPLVLLGSVLVFAGAGAGLLQLGLASINLCWPLLDLLASLELGVITLGVPGRVAFLAALLGVLLFLMPRGIPGRWLGLFWLLPLFFPRGEHLAQGELRLTLLDVGQGLAATVETAGHTLLYDTGPRFSSRFDTGRAVIIPFLRGQQRQAVDLLVQSHGDNDHIGGLSSSLAELQFAAVLSSVPEQVAHPEVRHCLRGQSWSWDGVNFEILHPATPGEFNGNDASCVLKVSTDDHALLLTGDIEAVAERVILARDVDKLASTLILAPHHGSLTSSSRDFVAAVAPDYALFAVGYRNRFGFPKQDILARYRQLDAKVMTTAGSGAIVVDISARGVRIRQFRDYARRFWNAVAE